MNARCLLVLLLVASACYDAPNPCPAGSEPEGGQCVKPDQVEPPVRSDAGDDAPDASADAGGDVDAGNIPTDGGEASTDAGMTSACLPDTVAAWAAYHAADGSVDSLETCLEDFGNGNLAAGTACLKTAAGVESSDCDDCLLGQGQCAADGCSAACSFKGGSDALCRACLCESGCAEAFLACAQQSRDVCTGQHYGEAAYDPDEHALDRPFLAALHAETHEFVSGTLAEDIASSPVLQRELGEPWSGSFTNLVPFWLGNRPYLLASKAEALPHGQTNVARISPIFKSGKLGEPFYQETWDAGWSDVEVFAANGLTFLLRYRVTGTPDVPAGTLRIDRLDADIEQRKITLTKAFEARGTMDASQVWTHIESFELLSHTYLLFHNQTQGGELRIDRVTASLDGVELATFSRPNIPALGPGFNIIETFTVGTELYLLAYAKSPGEDVKPDVRLYFFVQGLGGPSSAPRIDIYLSSNDTHGWPGSLEGIASFFDEESGGTYLVRRGPVPSDALDRPTFDVVRVVQGTAGGQFVEKPVASAAWGDGWTQVEALSDVAVW